MSAVRLPPPITAASAVDGALRERGHAVLDAAGLRTSLGVAGGALDTWPAYWHRLPPDTQLRDGGRYRQRRHGSFVVEGDGVRAVPHRAHWQPVEYNALHGGIERWFEHARVIHETTPIQPLDPAQRGHRDTLVVRLRAGGFQGPGR